MRQSVDLYSPSASAYIHNGVRTQRDGNGVCNWTCTDHPLPTLSLASQSAVLGFPRIGPKREVKKALESYWGGKIAVEELLKVAKEQRLLTYETIKSQGVDVIPT